MKHIKIILIGIFLSFITYKLLIDETPQGISISDKPSFTPITKHIKYKFLINRSLAENSDKLEALTEFGCGGGAGCYDHGWVLLQILIKVGDLKFSKMVVGFSNKNKSLLLGLLFVGGEYGPHKDHYYLEKNYPLTTRALLSHKKKSNKA